MANIKPKREIAIPARYPKKRIFTALDIAKLYDHLATRLNNVLNNSRKGLIG